jgi:hypothetical protein
MIIIYEACLSTNDDKEKEKIAKFLDRYRDKKQHMSYLSGLSQPDIQGSIQHIIESFGKYYYSYGSVCHEDSGRILSTVDPWGDDKLTGSADTKENELRGMIQDLHKLSEFTPLDDSFHRDRCETGFFTTTAGAVFTYHPLGPGVLAENWNHYVKYCTEVKDELSIFCSYLKGKGFNARVAREGQIDIIHDSFDVAKLYKEQFPKPQIITNNIDETIIDFEDAEMFVVQTPKEALEVIAELMKDY